MGYLRDRFLPRGYHYYDTPEGEDCAKKLWFVTKECAIYGVFGSTIDILLYSHPKGYIPTLGRYAYITLPFIGMGASFVMTTCMATNIRKKDDPWNYAIGGSSIGTVIGAWRKSLKVGVYSAFALAVISAVLKDCMDRGWTTFIANEPIYQESTNFWALKRDFTILKDPGRTWKKSYDE